MVNSDALLTWTGFSGFVFSTMISIKSGHSDLGNSISAIAATNDAAWFATLSSLESNVLKAICLKWVFVG